jgi:hypothetical protein
MHEVQLKKAAQERLWKTVIGLGLEDANYLVRLIKQEAQPPVNLETRR